jgi:hypothetical protein
VPNKRIERFYLEALRTVVPEIPSGHPTEPEPPDFLLRANRERLGIELTTFHLPPAPGQRPHQERQSLKDRTLELAQRLHHEASGPALYVGVYFNENIPLAKGDTQPLARAIAASVLSASIPKSIKEPVQIPWGHRPEATSGILISPMNGKAGLWYADRGGCVADITAQQVATAVQAKARIAPLARRRCDKLWLVIVSDIFSRAAPAEITSEALAAEYDALFDRLIWLVPQPPRAIDLRLRSPAA